MKVVRDGWRVGIFLSAEEAEEWGDDIDLKALCAALEGPFLPAYLQTEVYIDGALAAVFHYQLRRVFGNALAYAGPTRRFEDGRKTYCCRLYYIVGNVVKEGRRRCTLTTATAPRPAF